MNGNLRTKQGAWVKPGRTGEKPEFPGGYKDYLYLRGAPKDYKKTKQQVCFSEIGRRVGEVCEGLEGSEFTKCRHKAIKEVADWEECEGVNIFNRNGE